jgi:hypothetical protein
LQHQKSLDLTTFSIGYENNFKVIFELHIVKGYTRRRVERPRTQQTRGPNLKK